MIDRSAPEWQALKVYFTARLNELRDQLELPGTEEAHATIRGRIAEIRGLMNQVEPDSAPTEPAPDYV
jgi:hypothetical protein